jgi:release factor glutamine methyltransferase
VSNFLFHRLARSRVVAGPLLGLKLQELGEDEHYFDATTLALISVAREVVPKGARVLDVGCGSAAVLGLWLWKNLGCQVSCSEIDATIAEHARACIALNGAPIEVAVGEHFAGLAGPFDWVLCNPPYVPTETGRARGLPKRFRTQWDGGADGSEAIASFLAALERYGGAANALLGVNRRHVPRERVLELVGARAGLRVTGTARHPLSPSIVYVLASTKSPSASTSSPEA